MTYFIPLFLFIFSQLTANDNVISALSSLKCYYEPQQEISFNEEDVNHLWLLACSSNDEEIVELHHRFENNREINFEKEVTSAWERLRSKKKEESAIAQFLIPGNHPLKPSLDLIFHNSRAIQDAQSMYEAGFNRIQVQPISFVCIAGHPDLPGVLLKLYFDSETRMKDGVPGHVWLERRCQGAQNIRHLIRKKGIKHFVVPDKYLYPLPGISRQPYVLVVTDMNLASHEVTKNAWKNQVTKQHLEELYTILSHGFGSAYVVANVPLTQSGHFAFIDTEYPKRKVKLAQVKQFLSEPMANYWDKLVRKGGK